MNDGNNRIRIHESEAWIRWIRNTGYKHDNQSGTRQFNYHAKAMKRKQKAAQEAKLTSGMSSKREQFSSDKSSGSRQKWLRQKQFRQRELILSGFMEQFRQR